MCCARPALTSTAPIQAVASSDGGRAWEERKPPEGLIDLAAEPRAGRRVVASTETDLQASADEGRTWTPLGHAPPGLLSWAAGSLFEVDAVGKVSASTDGGRTWRPRGAIGAQPSSFAAADDRSLYAALADGTIMTSVDGARAWTLRSRP
jgi:hypothetical protein